MYHYDGSVLTPKQQNVLRFIQDYVQENGCAPSYQNIADAFSLASRSTAQKYVEKLKAAGVLDMNPNAKRGISLLQSGIHLPILGKVAAGIPIEYHVHQKFLEVPSSFVSPNENYYCLQVEGESMIEEGILSGDHIIVRKQDHATHGTIVVASINQESTLKKIFYKKEKIELRAANPKFAPLVVTPSMEFKIEGVLTGVLRLVNGF